jgi:hypothetical protein
MYMFGLEDKSGCSIGGGSHDRLDVVAGKVVVWGRWLVA